MRYLLLIILCYTSIYSADYYSSICFVVDSLPQLEIASLNQSIREEQTQSTMAEVLPHITLGLNQTIGYEAYDLPEENYYYPTSISISLNQQIFNLRNFQQIAIAKDNEEFSVIAYEQSLSNVLSSFSYDWAYLWRNERREKIINNIVEITRQDLSNTEYRYEVGELTRVDVTKITSKHYGYLNRYSNAEKDRRASVYKMNYLYHLDVPDSISLPILLNLPLYDSTNISEHPELRMSEISESIANKVRRQHISDFFPYISGSVTAKRIWNTTSSSLPASYNDIGGTVSFTWDIFNGTEHYSSLSESNYEREVAELEREQVSRSLINEINTSRHNLDVAKEQISISEHRLQAAKEVFDGTQSEYLSGTRTTTDLIIAQEEYLNSQLEAIDIEMAYFLSQITYLKSLGILTPNIIETLIESTIE